MKSKSKTGVTEPNRLPKRDEKQTASNDATKHVRTDNSRQDEIRITHTRGYYSRNGGHDGYRGL